MIITPKVQSLSLIHICRLLQATLLSIMDPERDSLRFYYLGRQYENKIEHFGIKQSYLPEEPMIL